MRGSSACMNTDTQSGIARLGTSPSPPPRSLVKTQQQASAGFPQHHRPSRDCHSLLPLLSRTGVEVGVDLGLASLAVTADGEKSSPPKFLRSALKRLGRFQRNLKHKQRGCNRPAKARHRVARLHAKHAQVADRRLDVLHKLGTRLIGENQAIYTEDLNVSGMLKNKRLSRSIADPGRRMLRSLLDDKAELYGRVLKVVSRWEPTSQTCSACGDRNGKKRLWVRQWQCPGCGTLHHRDMNTAKTILAACPAERLKGRGAKRKTGTTRSRPRSVNPS